MIITKTPFRISLFGGGTDHPDYYLKHGGKVLGLTIDKYCYIHARKYPPFFNFKYRICYSKIELKNNIDDIEHPAVRELIRLFNFDSGIELSHNADLPARSGLGSSSSFAVGLLNAFHGLNQKMVSKKQLALEAIDLERNILKEKVGSQDQTWAAFGGLNKIDFEKSGNINVQPLIISDARKHELEKHMLLFFTGISRFSSDVTKKQISNINDNISKLDMMKNYVDAGLEILSSNADMMNIGELLHDAWKIKKDFSKEVSSSTIDEIYDTGRRFGASGGKLLGAGGGGFMLFIARPEKHDEIKRALGHLIHVPVHFEDSGSQVIFYKS